MNEAIIFLGSTPALEHGARFGEADYERDARAECQAYATAIRRVCGREPEGAQLRVLGQELEGGLEYQLALIYDADDDWAAQYAAKVDSEAPTTWEQAGMTAPAKHSRSR